MIFDALYSFLKLTMILFFCYKTDLATLWNFEVESMPNYKLIKICWIFLRSGFLLFCLHPLTMSMSYYTRNVKYPKYSNNHRSEEVCAHEKKKMKNCTSRPSDEFERKDNIKLEFSFFVSSQYRDECYVWHTVWQSCTKQQREPRHKRPIDPNRQCQI